MFVVFSYKADFWLQSRLGSRSTEAREGQLVDRGYASPQ